MKTIFFWPVFASHLKTEAFENQNNIHYLNTRLVRYLDHHCSLMKNSRVELVRSVYIGDLNSKLVQYSDHGDLFDR